MVASTLLVSAAWLSAEASETASTGVIDKGDELKAGEFMPNVDWSRFNQVLVHPVQIAYTTDFELGSPYQRSRFRPRDIERTRRLFQDSMEKYFGRRYPITTKPGPNVLRIEAALVNPISDRSAFYRVHLYTNSRSKLSLIVVLRDSVNGDYLHHLDMPRVTGNVDRQTRGGDPWNFIRLVFDRVGRTIRYALKEGIAMGSS
jgi:hypothetical protein